RSRLPSDPPFQNQQLTYALEYVLSGILERTDRGARLNHDFAFSDRAGVIENFSLHLDLDPAWRGLPSPYEIQRRNIPPGQSVVVAADLTYVGQNRPAAVHEPPSSSKVALIPILILLAGGAVT